MNFRKREKNFSQAFSMKHFLLHKITLLLNKHMEKERKRPEGKIERERERERKKERLKNT